MPDTAKLTEIAKLKADGILSEEEFEVEKKKILMAGDAPPAAPVAAAAAPVTNTNAININMSAGGGGGHNGCATDDAYRTDAHGAACASRAGYLKPTPFALTTPF